MKRTMFTLTALLATAISFAQPFALNQPQNIQKAVFDPTNAKAYDGMPTLNVGKVKPMKTAATGNYYKRPAGSMYLDGFTATILATTYGKNVTFESVDKSAEWALGSNDHATLLEYGVIDGNNNFTLSGSTSLRTATGISNLSYLPTLTKGDDVYFLPNDYDLDADQNYTEVIGTEDNSMWASPDNVTGLTFQNPVGAAQYYGYGGGNYGFGSGPTSYRDPETQEVKQAYPYAVAQHFEAPMSPLYVENIYMTAISRNDNATPLKDGAQLTMTIKGDDGTTIATLTATADDLVNQLEGHPLYPSGTINYGEGWGLCRIWSITFNKLYYDEIFQQYVSEPFTIDQAFTVEISGFDNENVDLGFYLFQPRAEDPCDAGVSYCKDPVTGEDMTITSSMSIPISFNAMFDNVEVASTLSYYTDASQTETIEIENCNVLRISDDGLSCYMDNEAGEPYAYVYTASNWTNSYGDEVYHYEVAQSSDGTGEWITACNYDNSLWSEEYEIQGQSYTQVNNYVFLSFTGTECPAGEGRWAVLNIVGRGVTSETPIILLQGTATLDDVTTGIENAVVDNAADKGFNPNAPVYNLNGQRVSKSAKGILIQDGRKFIRK